MAKKFEDDFNEQFQSVDFDLDFKNDFKDEFNFDFDSGFDFGDDFKFDFPEIKIDIPGTEPEKEEEPPAPKRRGLFDLFKKKEPEKPAEEKPKDPFAFDIGFDFDSFNDQFNFDSSVAFAPDDFFASLERDRLERERAEREKLEREQRAAQEQLRRAQAAARKIRAESVRRQRYAKYFRAKQNIRQWFIDSYYNWAVVWDQLAEERRLKQIDKAAAARNYKRGLKRAAKLRANAVAQRKARAAAAAAAPAAPITAPPIPVPKKRKKRKKRKLALPKLRIPRPSEQTVNAFYTVLLLCALTAVFFTGLRYANIRFGIGDRKVYGVLPLELRKSAVELPAIEYDLREDINIPVLMYHHLAETGDDDSTISFALFEEHIKTITEAGYTSITPDDMRDYVTKGSALPAKPFIITFDDGYLSNFQHAYPVLKENGQKATIFVIGATIGNLTSYKETGGTITPHFTYTQGRVMQTSGYIDLQSHTYDMHQSEAYDDGEVRPNLIPLPGETRLHYAIVLRADIKLERETLAKMGVTDMHVMAYPYGLSTAYTDKVLLEEGIDITFTTYPGQNIVRKEHKEDMIEMHRWRMNETVDTKTLLEYLEPAGTSRTITAKKQ